MPRSTRNKIRFQIVKAAEMMDNAIEHLGYAEELADGRSEEISKHVVKLAIMLQGCKALLLEFRDGL